MKNNPCPCVRPSAAITLDPFSIACLQVQALQSRVNTLFADVQALTVSCSRSTVLSPYCLSE